MALVVSLVPCVREVRLLRRQTKTSLDVSLLEKYPCSKFIIAIGNNAVGKWRCYIVLLKEQSLTLCLSSIKSFKCLLLFSKKS